MLGPCAVPVKLFAQVRKLSWDIYGRCIAIVLPYADIAIRLHVHSEILFIVERRPVLKHCITLSHYPVGEEFFCHSLLLRQTNVCGRIPKGRERGTTTKTTTQPGRF